MHVTKQLRGPCQQCGNTLSFPASQIGSVVTCPRCGQPTELMLESPPDEPLVPRRVLVWTTIAIVILILGLGGAVYALKRAQAYVRDHAHPPATNQPAGSNQ